MITGLYAGVLGLLFFRISMDTISARRSHKIALGSGPNNEIAHLIAAHSNFSAYAPVLLFLLYLLETSAVHPVVVHGLGIVIVAGRVVHYLSMKSRETTFSRRKLGMMMTLYPLIILSALAIGFYIRGLLAN